MGEEGDSISAEACFQQGCGEPGLFPTWTVSPYF